MMKRKKTNQLFTQIKDLISSNIFETIKEMVLFRKELINKSQNMKKILTAQYLMTN